MKKLIAVSILALTITLTACAGGGDKTPSTPAPPPEPKTVSSSVYGYDQKLYAETIKLEDGREITCVLLVDQVTDKSISGLSCDWETARAEYEETR